MIFQVYQPPPSLGCFITSFTYYEGYQPGHSIDRFLPDGEVELVIDLTDFPKFIYDNETLTERQACRYSWISGLRRKFIAIHSCRDAVMLIVRFHPGRGGPLIGIPLSELTEKVVDGDLVFGPVIHDLREQLLAKSGPMEKILVAERFFRHRMRGAAINPCVDYAVNRILMDPTQVTIGELCQRVGYSQKHLIHLFRQYLGLSPKSFLRIIRFQRAITEIERTDQTRWTQLALDCGYFDQAHFIRDFKAFSGFTPGEYLGRKNGMLNYIPVK